MINSINNTAYTFVPPQTHAICIQNRIDEVLAKATDAYVQEAPVSQKPGHRLPIHMMNLEADGQVWRLTVSPLGTWASLSRKATGCRPQMFCITQAPANFQQSDLRMIEHLSNMVSQLPQQPQMMVSDFKQQLKNVTTAFDNLRTSLGGGDQHLECSKAAFRELLRNHNYLAPHLALAGISAEEYRELPAATWASRIAQVQPQIDRFGELFLNNFEQHGAERAFEIAWREIF